jgi:raffinose/stachyose/melibiose transport system substrate-binding protein
VAAVVVPIISTAANAATAVTIHLSMQNANVKLDDPATYQIVQEFMKLHPSIKVVIEGQPVAQHEQAITIAAQSGTLPDIFWVYNALAIPMAKQGELLNLLPILTSLKLTSQFPSNMLSGFRIGGDQYGLPYQSLVTGFYYNKALFNKYNVPLPTEGTTYAQLLQDVTTFKQNNVVPIAQGANNSSFSVWAFLTMLDRYGYQNLFPEMVDGKASYNNKALLSLYTKIQALQQAGAFPSNITTQSYFQAVEQFTSGQAAMLDSGVWAAGQIQQSSIGNQVGMWAGPTFSDGVGNQKLFMDAPSAPFVVSAKVKKNAALYNAVKAFIGFYYTVAGQKILVNNAQAPVTNYQPTGKAAKQPVFASVLKMVHTPGWTAPQAQPDLLVSAATANAMYDSLYGVMEGVLSPQAAVQSVAQVFKSA